MRKYTKINKILGIILFFALIGISINAQPMKLTDNETSYTNEIVNNYINSSGFNLSNYTLKVVPIAFFMNEKKFVDVLLIPEKPADGLIKFVVDLNSGDVIKKSVKPEPNFFMKSRQDMSRVRDAFMIANNNPELRRNFALRDFKRIPHMQPYNGNKYHITFMPMDFCEMMNSRLLPHPQGFEDNQNITLVDVNVSLKDRKVIGFGVRPFFAGECRRCSSDNCTFPAFAEGHNYSDGGNCTFPAFSGEHGYFEGENWFGKTRFTKCNKTCGFWQAGFTTPKRPVS